MKQHKLIIRSLRDLDATCSCGGWNLIGRSSDTESDVSIRRHAATEHKFHAKPLRKKSVPKFPVMSQDF